MNDILPVILSGGSGTRLWPLSRKGHPKQFLPLLSKYSLFQETLIRTSELKTTLSPLVICNSDHRFIIAEQAQEVKCRLNTIILEPVSKNTAPAVALAAIKAQENGKDPLLLVLPSDHSLSNLEEFKKTIQAGASAANARNLVIFGIPPTSPASGYGYIKSGYMLDEGGQRVEKFIEKPIKAQAEKYLKEGNYTWNSGIFLFRASTYLEELEKFQPEILKVCRNALENSKSDLDFCRINSIDFEKCPSNSIDYSVMEHTDRAAVLQLNVGWSDVGTWPAVWEATPRDTRGNSTHGDVHIDDSDNTYVYAQSRLVCVLGGKNLNIIETPDVVMVTTHDRAQDVKNLVNQLDIQDRKEVTEHRQVFRPWGHYDSVDTGPRFKVKRITVKPGGKLSLQMHHHRAEHWIVVSGTAIVKKGENEFLLTENQSTHISIGEIHSLENPGKINLEIIEIQTGPYLGEDDIIRINDIYGRI